MTFVRKKTELKGRQYDTDRILTHVKNVILDGKHSPEQLSELVAAYTNLLEVRLDME